jgi:NRAMP (natural resistance-associated macrophage protein)-like metal ion transporter
VVKGRLEFEIPPKGTSLSSNADRRSTKPTKAPPSGVEEKSGLQLFGAGLITGAADDDPSGIATYSQAGAQFGYSLSWTLLLTYPLMVGIQLASARIGRATGEGLAANFALRYPRWIVAPLIGLMVVANVVNLGADINAMADALTTAIGGPKAAYAIAFSVLSLGLQTFVPYERYVRVLKWLTFALLAYVAVAIVSQVHWGEAIEALFVPRFQWTSAYWTTVVAILGTTISPYLFFWQAQQEVESIDSVRASKPLREEPRKTAGHLRRIRIDTIVGMGVSNAVAFFMIVAAAATLHAHGIQDLATTSDAAKALEPIAGKWAVAVFALGIVGTGLLALPVLAGSAAYAVASNMQVRCGLTETVRTAPAFYSILACAMMVGAALSLMGFPPIKLLYWSAVVNAVISMPIMAAVMLTASSPATMGKAVLTRRWKVLGWAATLLMGAGTLVMVLASTKLLG